MIRKRLNDLTVVMTWYGQENHLFNQMEFYNRMYQTYPHLCPRLIVINDGHEKGRDFFREVIDVHRDRFDLTGIDVLKDVGFNSHACRNLGVKQCKTDWMLLMDVDCFESIGMYKYLRFFKDLDPNMWYAPKADMEMPEEMSSYELLDPKAVSYTHLTLPTT